MKHAPAPTSRTATRMLIAIALLLPLAALPVLYPNPAAAIGHTGS